jgi:hypothetical protein
MFALTGQAAHAAVVIPITPPPDAASTTVFGINDDSVIAGSYRDADGIEHGFVGPLNGSYTVFDFGGTSIGTEPRAIANDGSINGFAQDPSFVVGEEFFRLANGTIGPITKDGVPLDGVAHGILAARGDIMLGDYQDPTFTFFGGYVASNGVFRRDINLDLQSLDVLNTRPRALNKDKTMAGFIETTAFVRHGFIVKAGELQLIDADDSGTTVLEGLNNHEFASGQVADADGNPHSFTYDNVTGTFTTIDLGDGSAFQQAWGVNNLRLITVSTSDGLSYVYCAKAASQCPDGGFVVADGRSWQIDSRATLRSDRRGMAAPRPVRGEIQ